MSFSPASLRSSLSPASLVSSLSSLSSLNVAASSLTEVSRPSSCVCDSPTPPNCFSAAAIKALIATAIALLAAGGIGFVLPALMIVLAQAAGLAIASLKRFAAASTTAARPPGRFFTPVAGMIARTARHTRPLILGFAATKASSEGKVAPVVRAFRILSATTGAFAAPKPRVNAVRVPESGNCRFVFPDPTMKKVPCVFFTMAPTGNAKVSSCDGQIVGNAQVFRGLTSPRDYPKNVVTSISSPAAGCTDRRAVLVLSSVRIADHSMLPSLLPSSWTVSGVASSWLIRWLSRMVDWSA